MDAVFMNILNLSITASFLVVVVFLLRFVLNKTPKWIHCVLWGMVAVRLICPFTAESKLSLMPDAVGNGSVVSEWTDDYIGQTNIIEDSSPDYSGAVLAGRKPISNGDGGYYVVTDADRISEPKTVENTIVPIASKIWIVGMVVMVVYTIISYLRLKRQVLTATRYRANIKQSENVDSPFVLGIIKPTIYVPYKLSDDELAYVISHEEAHIQRKDYWWKPLGFILLSIHWFNPLMWMAYVVLCRDIELACDEKVIKNMESTDRKAYSMALLNCSIHRRRIAACPVAFGEVGVKERVKSVMNYKKPAFWVIIIAVLACAITAICFMTKPNSNKQMDDELEAFLDCEIASHHKSDDSKDLFGTLDYQILDTEVKNDIITLYMWVLYQEYSYADGKIQMESGAHIPTVITAREGKSYELVEYWEPRDGNLYADDIRDKFPMRLWEDALDSQKYIDIQIEACETMAQEHFAEYLYDSNIDNTDTSESEGDIENVLGTYCAEDMFNELGLVPYISIFEGDASTGRKPEDNFQLGYNMCSFAYFGTYELYDDKLVGVFEFGTDVAKYVFYREGDTYVYCASESKPFEGYPFDDGLVFRKHELP